MDAVPLYAVSVILATLGLTMIMRRRRLKPKIKRRYWVRPWIKRREGKRTQNILHLYKELISDGDVQEFKSTLRMSPETYYNLLEVMRPAITKQFTNFRNPISAEARLAVTLRYVALGDSFRSISQAFRIGPSTTRAVVRHTCKALYEVLGPQYMQTPNTTEDWLKVAEDFNTKWQFPHCIGAVDGKHIRITAPRNTGSFYHNYKDYFSIVLLAIVNASYEFLYLDIGAEGKASDGGIWSKCTFNQHIQDDTNPLNIPQAEPVEGIEGDIPYFIVGDDAFRLGPHMMKRFPGQGLTRGEQIYNYRFSRARRIVESAFGILTTRFQIFRKSIEVNPEFVSEIVLACCTLHNFLRRTGGAQYITPLAVDQEDEDGSLIPGAWRQESSLSGMRKDSQKNPSQFAKSIRQRLSAYFLTEAGEIPWQYRQALL